MTRIDNSKSCQFTLPLNFAPTGKKSKYPDNYKGLCTCLCLVRTLTLKCAGKIRWCKLKRVVFIKNLKLKLSLLFFCQGPNLRDWTRNGTKRIRYLHEPTRMDTNLSRMFTNCAWVNMTGNEFVTNKHGRIHAQLGPILTTHEINRRGTWRRKHETARTRHEIDTTRDWI